MKTLKSLALTALAAAALGAQADAITDWNAKTNELIHEARMGTPPAMRLMAYVQTAAYRAVEGAQREKASVDAAVAAAHRAALTRLLPSQQAAVDTAYRAALGAIAEGQDKSAGVAVGEKAVSDLFAQRGDDGAATPESYRPHTTAGAYVPTAVPAVTQWPQRRTWVLSTAAQMRPAAPPDLASDIWARDFNEVKTIGARQSTRRTAEQTEIARFWDYSLPGIYHGVLRSVALQPGRDVLGNARLFAISAQAMDDALISVFDAKYAYNFWRPVTAIRNADLDPQEATQRDPAWASLIEAPMHPEYPSGHGVLAGAMAAVLKAEFGSATIAGLATSSPTAKGATRRWANVDELVQEIGVARIYGGIHFRSAVETAEAMGRRIGTLAAERWAAH